MPSIRFKSCGKCNAEGKILVRVKGGTKEIYCECYKNFVNNQRLNLKLKEANLGTIDYVQNLSLDNYKGNDPEKNIEHLKKYVSDFALKFHSIHLFVYGEQGTQKTTSCKAVLKELAKKGYKVLYMNSQEFFTMCGQLEFNEQTGELTANEMYKKFMSTDCLVLDEWDENKISLYKSGWKQKLGIAPLKNRLEVARKATIFISNQTIEEIKESELGDTYGDLVDRETVKLGFHEKYIKDISSIWD